MVSKTTVDINATTAGQQDGEPRTLGRARRYVPLQMTGRSLKEQRITLLIVNAAADSPDTASFVVRCATFDATVRDAQQDLVGQTAIATVSETRSLADRLSVAISKRLVGWLRFAENGNKLFVCLSASVCPREPSRGNRIRHIQRDRGILR